MTSLICSVCRQSFSANIPRWKCSCGGLLDILHQPEFSLKEIESRTLSMWRYRHSIPIDSDANIVSFQEGFTPLLDVNLQGLPIKVKMDFLFPSGSYKDRGASVLVSKCKELGVEHIVEDSSGNAGAAIATYCARANIACDIYAPDSASPEKLLQIEAMGARLFKIPGSREETARAVLSAAETSYYASHAWNPFFLHGAKTIAFEICEQLGWQAPDIFCTPVGNGTLLLGAYIGFSELVQTGLIKKMPQIFAVQAENCAPCAQAFFQHKDKIVPVDKKPTMAEGIAVAQPIRGAQILAAVRTTDGDFFTVSEDEITFSLRYLYKKGFYIEPTAAVVFAGIKKFLQKTKKNQTIVSVLTGHGLKSNKKTDQQSGKM